MSSLNFRAYKDRLLEGLRDYEGLKDTKPSTRSLNRCLNDVAQDAVSRIFCLLEVTLSSGAHL